MSGAWVRTSPRVANAGALYLEVANHGDADDALIGATVDPSVAEKVVLHETVASEGGMADSPMATDTSTTKEDGADTTIPGTGMMEMRPVERIEIPAGGSVGLQPGGYHLMLLELARPLEAGTQIKVTLTFDKAGAVPLTAEVRDTES